MISQNIRDSARGETCTIQAVGICQGGTETTVLAHLPSEWKGMGNKSPDLGSAVYACYGCHLWLDGSKLATWADDDYCEAQNHRDWYMLRALQRTLMRLYEKGIITIKGMKT